MKKAAILAIAAAAASATLLAAPATTRRNAGATVRNGRAAAAQADDSAANAKANKIMIDQFPKTGRPSTLSAPSLSGASNIGVCYTKPRKWIVLEAKYTTYAKWTDQLNFTWHVLLETKSATEKDKEDRETIPPYSYFNQTVTYVNIPKGSHAASVCLPPSYLERYGEPKAIGLVITNAEGEMLNGDGESEIKDIKSHTKWWEESKIMDAKQANGEPMIERRQGLVDRSKTIWAIVNPNDYEMVAQ